MVRHMQKISKEFQQKLLHTKVLAFDADDTLWDCQSHFDNIEKTYIQLLTPYAEEKQISEQLFQVEMRNMPLLGYGCKAFTLSLIENAVKMSGGRIIGSDIEKIIALGRSLLLLPATPLEGVEPTLARLRDLFDFKMIVFTKGELLDQENKIDRSGLRHYFDEILIVSDKTSDAYKTLCKRYGILINELTMVGNSFRSDIAPILELGGNAIHIPFHIEWQHEQMETYKHAHLLQLERFDQLLNFFTKE